MVAICQAEMLTQNPVCKLTNNTDGDESQSIASSSKRKVPLYQHGIRNNAVYWGVAAYIMDFRGFNYISGTIRFLFIEKRYEKKSICKPYYQKLS